MEPDRFDKFVRDLAVPRTRRSFFGKAAAAAIAALAAVGIDARNTVLAQGSSGDCGVVGDRPYEVCAVHGTHCRVNDEQGLCCTNIHRCRGWIARLLRRFRLLGPCSECLCRTDVDLCPE